MIVGILKKIYDIINDTVTITRAPLSIVHVQKTTADGNIIAAPGSGKKLRIYYIGMNNEGTTVGVFEVQKGSTGDVIWRRCLCTGGGDVEIHLPCPVDLSENTSLYYDYISGTTPIINFSVQYESVDV